SKSGVTIATGFDLGQRDENDLARLGLSPALVTKSKPYLGKKGISAVEFLRKKPLVITSDQSTSIDKAVKSVHVKSLKSRYSSSSHNSAKKDLFYLPAEAQTVIASVSLQYRTNLSLSAPKFRKSPSTQNWSSTVKGLKAFGHLYTT